MEENKTYMGSSRDVFTEQLVVIEKTGKTVALKIALFSVALLFAVGMVIIGILHFSVILPVLLAACGGFFAAYYLCTQLNVEFEYIFTNGDIDIDRICNKSRRTRMASFDCKNIEDIEKYDPARHVPDKKQGKNVYFGCTPDENSLALRVRHPSKGYYTLVFSPDDNFRESMKKYLSYTLRSKLSTEV